MVAVDEELFGVFAIQPLIVGEDSEPGIGHPVQLRQQSVVGHIACYYHAIHTLGAEVFEGMHEGIHRTVPRDMDITKNTDDNIGISQCLQVRSQTGNPCVGGSNQCC